MDTQYTYRSARKRLRVFTAAAWVLAISAALSVGIDLLGEALYPTWDDMEADISGGEWILMAIALLVVLVNIAANLACIVSFCMWAHRSNCNARARGATGMRFTPGWTVGWFFVPIMNLFRPYQAIAEIDRASAPSGVASANRSTPALLGFWWAAWLISTFVGRISFRLQLNDLLGRGSVSERLLDTVDLTHATFVAVSSVLAVAMMRRIVDNQDHRSVAQVFE